MREILDLLISAVLPSDRGIKLIADLLLIFHKNVVSKIASKEIFKRLFAVFIPEYLNKLTDPSKFIMNLDQ